MSRVLELLKRHGWNATAFQALEPGLTYWWDGDDACVAYVDTGSAWVAAGGPIAPPERLAAVAEAFAAAAYTAGRRAAFFATERRFTERSPMETMPIGEQPVWDPSAWETTLKSSRSLREQLRRARAKGVTVRALDPAEVADESSELRKKIDRLIERWLGSRPMAPMGFLVQVHPFSFAAERRYFVAERGGEPVAFLNMIPVYARGGWFLEDLLRDPAAPNGTAELLVDAAMRAAAAEGSRYATLGLAPLAGDVGWLRTARAWGALLYDFEGIRSFKAKLRPQAWDPIYLSFPRGQSGVLSIVDSLGAFARGGLLRFGLETLLRGPAIVIRLLALLLIPWTIALALPQAAPWFPSRTIQYAWVAFDTVLAGSILSLTLRWRRWLATGLAALVTADAVLTLVEAILAHTRKGPLTVLAVIAPAFAAFLLWRARAHRP